MKTARGKATHNKIVDAALTLFSVQPVAKTSVAEICQEAGIAKGTFYIYFETKDDLVWHFVEHHFESLFDWFDSISTLGHSAQDIHAILSFITTYMKDNRTLLHTTHATMFLEYFDDAQIRSRLEHRMMVPVAAWLRHGVERGTIVPIDPTFVSRFLVSAVHDMVDQVIYGHSPYSPDELQHLLLDTLTKLLLHSKE